MSKHALIFGVSGQDGAYLARFLLEKGYRVFGTSRDAQLSSFANLRLLGIYDAVQTLSANPADFRSVLDAITRTEPQEIYNLTGRPMTFSPVPASCSTMNPPCGRNASSRKKSYARLAASPPVQKRS